MGWGRLVVVADKGLNSSKNIDALVNNGDGFVFSQTLRGKKGHPYNDTLFDQSGWTSNESGTYFYKLFTEEYGGRDKNIRITHIAWEKRPYQPRESQER